MVIKKKREKLNVTGPADHINFYLASPLDFFVVPDQRTTANFEPCLVRFMGETFLVSLKLF